MAKAWAAAYPARTSPLMPTSAGDGTGGASAGSAKPVQPLLNLAQGVPGHEPHTSLMTAMAQERDRQPMETHGYGGVFGDEKLRSALATDLNRVYAKTGEADNQPIQAANIAITAGCNLAAAVTFHALAAPGEAIVLPTPWYFNHQMTLVSLAIEVVPLDSPAPEFRPSLATFEKLLEERNNGSSASRGGRIKAIVLVTPNNPTGSIYSPALLASFARVCRQWGVACIVDETYRDFLLQGDLDQGSAAATASQASNGLSGEQRQQQLARPHTLFSDSSLGWESSVISLHSFSKSYAIPGHRLGAIVAHPSLLITQAQDDNGSTVTRFGSLAKSLDNMQICPPRTDTQRAVAHCVLDREHGAWRLSIANDLRARRAAFVESLDATLSLGQALDQLGIAGAHKEHILALCARQGDDDGSSGGIAKSPSGLGWKTLSAGGYYAYVRHPFPDAPSELVARGLALLSGVVVLPGSFFRPAAAAQADRDLRFSIANVESRRLDTLAARLVLFTRLWQAQGDGWGL